VSSRGQLTSRWSEPAQLAEGYDLGRLAGTLISLPLVLLFLLAGLTIGSHSSRVFFGRRRLEDRRPGAGGRSRATRLADTDVRRRLRDLGFGARWTPEEPVDEASQRSALARRRSHVRTR